MYKVSKSITDAPKVNAKSPQKAPKSSSYRLPRPTRPLPRALSRKRAKVLARHPKTSPKKNPKITLKWGENQVEIQTCFSDYFRKPFERYFTPKMLPKNQYKTVANHLQRDYLYRRIFDWYLHAEKANAPVNAETRRVGFCCYLQ